MVPFLPVVPVLVCVTCLGSMGGPVAGYIVSPPSPAVYFCMGRVLGLTCPVIDLRLAMMATFIRVGQCGCVAIVTCVAMMRTLIRPRCSVVVLWLVAMAVTLRVGQCRCAVIVTPVSVVSTIMRPEVGRALRASCVLIPR